MENVVALCDVNDHKIAETFQRWEEGIQRFADAPHSWEQKAAQFEQKIEFNPIAMKIAGNPQADVLLRSDYREGWSL